MGCIPTGIPRPLSLTVTVIAGVLQRSGLIEYQRGRVRILNRENLEAAACDCYQITKDLYTNLYAKALPTFVEDHSKVREIRSGNGSSS